MSILVKFRELSRSLKILSIDYKLKKIHKVLLALSKKSLVTVSYW
jgi:hypothetical protein